MNRPRWVTLEKQRLSTGRCYFCKWYKKLTASDCATRKPGKDYWNYTGALKIFGSPWLRPRLSQKFVMGFYSDRPVNLRTKFDVRSFTRSPWDNRDNQNIGESVTMPTLLFPQKSIGLPYRLFLYVHSISRNFRLEFWVGVANPQSWERGGCRVWDVIAQKSAGEFLIGLP